MIYLNLTILVKLFNVFPPKSPSKMNVYRKYGFIKCLHTSTPNLAFTVPGYHSFKHSFVKHWIRACLSKQTCVIASEAPSHME